MTPSPVLLSLHSAGLLLTCSRPRSGCGTRPCSARTSSPSRLLCTGRSPSCHTEGAGTLQGPQPPLRLKSSRENTWWGDGEPLGEGELTKTIPPSRSKGRGLHGSPTHLRGGSGRAGRLPAAPSDSGSAGRARSAARQCCHGSFGSGPRARCGGTAPGQRSTHPSGHCSCKLQVEAGGMLSTQETQGSPWG